MPIQVKHHTQVRTVDRKKIVGDILRSLPDYFTFEPTIEEYCDLSLHEASSTFVAVTESGVMAGFAIMVDVNEATSEVIVMAVRPEWHRQGVGSSLLGQIETQAKERGKKFVMLKTIGPSQNDALAIHTYSFFLANKYCLLEEFEYLWQECFCAMMVKRI